MTTIWGIHMGRQHGSAPIEEGYISLGWSQIGDLRALPSDRDAFKNAFARAYPDAKPGAVPVHAGVLYRYVSEMTEGDIVVYPSKADRVVNIGRVGSYSFHPEASDDEMQHRRSIEWLAHVPRSNFPQAALNEIGSALTLFQVANNPEPFLAALDGMNPQPAGEEEETSEAAATTQQVEEQTEDFVVKRLKNAITPERFEHFISHLLECMGYHARVTKFANDGGIDVIAHRDELGFEPPVIKVQCKQVTDTVGRPAVQQLMGAVAASEYGLFVTLGSFAAPAFDMERQTPNLRLIDGPALADLVFEHYDAFQPQWQAVIPLKQRYVPGPNVADS